MTIEAISERIPGSIKEFLIPCGIYEATAGGTSEAFFAVILGTFF